MRNREKCRYRVWSPAGGKASLSGAKTRLSPRDTPGGSRSATGATAYNVDDRWPRCGRALGGPVARKTIVRRRTQRPGRFAVAQPQGAATRHTGVASRAATDAAFTSAEALTARHLAAQRPAGARFWRLGEHLPAYVVCLEAAVRTIRPGRFDPATERGQAGEQVAGLNQAHHPHAQTVASRLG